MLVESHFKYKYMKECKNDAFYCIFHSFSMFCDRQSYAVIYVGKFIV